MVSNTLVKLATFIVPNNHCPLLHNNLIVRFFNARNLRYSPGAPQYKGTRITVSPVDLRLAVAEPCLHSDLCTRGCLTR